MAALIERLPLLLEGLSLTIMVAILALMVALFMGLCGAAAKISSNIILNWIGEIYTAIVRGVPEVVLLLLLFFGFQILLNQLTDYLGIQTFQINAFAWGVMVLGFIYGAYMTETFRGAWLSIPRGQMEAAKSCGMSNSLMFRRIIWPQLMRYALPGLGNNWLVLVKATALVSLIGLKDIVWWANSLGKSVHLPFTFMLAVLIAYLGINEISQRIFNILQKKYNIGTVSFTDAQGR